MPVAYSGNASELIDSVRNSLGGVNSNLLKDGVITEHQDRVERWIDNRIDPSNHDQDDIDEAIVVYTAEKAWRSIPAKSTISGGGLTANMAVEQYINSLEKQSSEALAAIGLVHPQKDQASAINARTDGILR